MQADHGSMLATLQHYFVEEARIVLEKIQKEGQEQANVVIGSMFLILEACLNNNFWF
jgi:hypothetical protein